MTGLDAQRAAHLLNSVAIQQGYVGMPDAVVGELVAMMRKTRQTDELARLGHTALEIWGTIAIGPRLPAPRQRGRLH